MAIKNNMKLNTAQGQQTDPNIAVAVQIAIVFFPKLAVI